MERLNMTLQELEKAALDIRIDLLRLCNREVIHIGGDLSVADIMTILWQYRMDYDPKCPDDEMRDRFVLSKGHASAVTSLNQAYIGCFPVENVIDEYAQDGGRFSMHSCSLVNPYVDVSTGSLGHGFPIACGIAEGLRLKGNDKSRVYVVMGDGEQSEGSVWEAVANASHLKLGNLVAFIDNNDLSADGRIDELTAMTDLAGKYAAFGWKVYECNGNEMSELKDIVDNLPDASSDKPVAVVAHTVKGCGVSFMENEAKWHAGKVTEEQLKTAVDDLQGRYDRKWGKM
ncbi:MAG: transketolase [Lachnospiraceae bacterium]|nr:transketolase [Lachnospiraceae bacterium]